MKIENLFSRNVVTIESNERLKDALKLMISNKFHQLPVVDEEYKGMVNLKDIALSNMNAETTKVSRFIVKAPILYPGMSVEEAAEKILNSGLRALPVFEGRNLVGILSESDLVKVAENINIDDIVSRPVITIGKDESVGKARKILREENISRLPVVDEEGKVVGIVSDIDMAKILVKEEHPMTPEKLPSMDLPVSTIMSEVRCMELGAPFEKVKEHMKEYDECIFVKDGVPEGIITARDIIEKMIPPKKIVEVNYIKFDDVDDIEMEKIHETVERFVTKMSKMFEIQSLFFHLKCYEVDGERKKFSLRGRVYTNKGLFTAKSNNWTALSAMQELIDHLERIMKKKHEKG